MSEDKMLPNDDEDNFKIEKKSKSKKEKKRKRTNTDNAEDTKKDRKKFQNIKSEEEEEEVNDDETEVEDVKQPKKPSKRQQKKDKAEKKITDQREASKLEATQKALNYISKWKHAKSDWKFEKLRQIWLMDNLLDNNLVPESIFPIVLEYFEGCKGMARQQLVKKMMEVIKKVEESEENEKEEDNEDNKEITNSSEYQRARKILQALPTEG